MIDAAERAAAGRDGARGDRGRLRDRGREHGGRRRARAARMAGHARRRAARRRRHRVQRARRTPMPTATVLDDVVASALGTAPRADLAVLLPPFAAWEPPGRIDGDQLRARRARDGARRHGARDAGRVRQRRRSSGSPSFRSADAEVQSRCTGSIPTRGFHAVRVQGATVVATRLDAAAWQAAVALGRRAVAHQIAGACRAMLDLARTHALERRAVRSSDRAVPGRAPPARGSAGGGGGARGDARPRPRDEPNPDTAALAKAVAGRTARTVAAHCQQVLAGIGFTTEHPFHRFLKRTMALEGLFGSADEIVLDLGRQLLAARTVPTLIEL